jgi:PadR family transcriptional regulator, regulatory protein PadR
MICPGLSARRILPHIFRRAKRGIDSYIDICWDITMARPRNASHQTRLLLVTMLEQPRAWHYGYELSKATGLTSGTLYPLLMRLGDRGFLESQWIDPERVGRPSRHAYRLTKLGVELAQASRNAAADNHLVRQRAGATA